MKDRKVKKVSSSNACRSDKWQRNIEKATRRFGLDHGGLNSQGTREQLKLVLRRRMT